MTRTYVECPVSPATHAEIKAALIAAGYNHAIWKGGTIDMHGLALVVGTTQTAPEAMTALPAPISVPVSDAQVDAEILALIEEHLGLKPRRDDTVIDQRTGRYHDAQRYRDFAKAVLVKWGAQPVALPAMPESAVVEPVACDECGATHRPGENPLCPITQPQQIAEPASEPPDDDPTPKAQYRRMFNCACEALGEISESLGLDPNEGGGEPILAAIQELKAQSALAAASGAVRAYISPTRTVADLVSNLMLMDQSLPIYGAQTIEHPEGRRRTIAIPPAVSRERVKDSRWIGEGDTINAAVIWTKAEQPAPAVVGLGLRAVIDAAASKLDAAMRCHPNAVEVLIAEALEILDGDKPPQQVAEPAMPVPWVPGPNEFKDWCSRWFGPDADDSYLAKAAFDLPPTAQQFERSAAAPQPPAQAQDAWQTIETAPKDGTEILLRSAKGRIADGLWSAASERSGFWAWTYVNQEPAEWMPLPLAQAKEDAQDDKAFVERGMRRIRDAEDAQRYRLLRRGQKWSVIDGIGDTLRGDVLDAAIDAAPQPQQIAEPAQVTLEMIADILGTGSEARKNHATLIRCIENAIRRSDCLSRIERGFFMVPTDDDEDEEPGEECLLNWGQSPDEYAKQFGKALDAIIAARGTAQVQAMLAAAPRPQQIAERIRADAVAEYVAMTANGATP